MEAAELAARAIEHGFDPNPDSHIRIWYHGTNRAAARAIRSSGFREGTYFAKNLDDALGYGGDVVFSVALQTAEDYEALNWQIRASVHIPPERIVRVTVYRQRCIHEDESLRELIFQRALARHRAERKTA